MGQRARDLIGAAVARGVAPLLKGAGFRKARPLCFQRPTDEVLQVIDFQLSQANIADTGEFFVNVALGIDRLWELEGGPRPDRPKVHECQVRKRLEEVVPGPLPLGRVGLDRPRTPWRGDCRTRARRSWWT